jgi:hypothetical protein
MPPRSSRNSDTTRRAFLRGTGLGLLSFSLVGVPVLLTPRQAHARGADFKSLGGSAVLTLEALGEALVPGAREAGIAHFIDQQMSAEPNESLFMAKYLNVSPPYSDFYRAGLTALDRLSDAQFGAPFDELAQEKATTLIRSISNSIPDGWEGPPAPLFYICVRADAVDVVYGTVEGFAKLKIPYMPHILPPEGW